MARLNGIDMGTVTIKWTSDGLVELQQNDCKHGIERSRCLDVECVRPSGIPVRGEKSWDSALQPPNGGLFPNPNQWQYLTLTARKSVSYLPWNPSWFQIAESPSPSQPEPDARLRMMPVIGYRGWRVIRASKRGSDGRYREGNEIALQSLNGGEWARTEVTHAKCISYSHGAPNYHCECGLYVLSSLADAPKWYGGTWPDGVLVGAVIGWGNVIQHGDEGWRAEHARPIAFLDTSLFKDEPLVEAAAQQYGVPVLPRKSLQLLAKEYGEAFA